MADTLTPTGQAALAYAEQGWRVLPLHTVYQDGCSCGNDECEDIGKHPAEWLVPHGANSASDDADTVRGWWAEFPNANVGIATGEASGVVALDVDPRHDGEACLQQLQDEHGPLPETLTTISGGGGWHLWFAYPNGGVRSGQLFGRAVQLQSDGWLAVMPPSYHESGQRYRFRDADWQAWFPLPELPQWVIDLKGPKRNLQLGSESAQQEGASSYGVNLGSLTQDPLPKYQSQLHPNAVELIYTSEVPDRHPSPSERDIYVANQLLHAGASHGESKYILYKYPIGKTLSQRHANVSQYLDWTIYNAHPLTLIAKYHIYSLRKVLMDIKQANPGYRRRKTLPISNEDLLAALREHRRIDEKTFRTFLDFLNRTQVRRAKPGKTSSYHLEKLDEVIDKLKHRTPTQILDEFASNL